MEFWENTDLIVSIQCHKQPIFRFIGNPKHLPDCYFIFVNFANTDIKDEDRKYWYELGFCPAFTFEWDGKFMFDSCPIEGSRGNYSPKWEYEMENGQYWEDKEEDYDSSWM